MSRITCPSCGGSGRRYDQDEVGDPCMRCREDGFIEIDDEDDELAELRVRVERAETILRKLLVPTRLDDDEKAYLLTFSGHQADTVLGGPAEPDPEMVSDQDKRSEDTV